MTGSLLRIGDCPCRIFWFPCFGGRCTCKTPSNIGLNRRSAIVSSVVDGHLHSSVSVFQSFILSLAIHLILLNRERERQPRRIGEDRGVHSQSEESIISVTACEKELTGFNLAPPTAFPRSVVVNEIVNREID